MSYRSSSIAVTSLFAMTCLTQLGCAGFSKPGNPCGIEKPGIDVIEEQLEEAIRAEDAEPVLPGTYEYLKRLDRDCGIFDE